MPQVSVIMSVKNGLPHLGESIQSVLNQSFRDFEFIIVDDGSTDNTAQTIRSFKDQRIKLIQQANTGVATAKNRAVAQTSGRYIAIIDADDIWFTNKLEHQVKFMEQNPDYVLVGGGVQIIDNEGNYLYTEKKPVSHEENLRLNDIKNTWTHSAILFTKEAFDSIGGYFEPIKQYIVDYILAYQMALVGKVYQLPEVVLQYRITPEALSTKADSTAFRELTQRSIRAGSVSEADQKLLAEIKAKESKSPQFKESMYHLYLGRSYLFHNYQPQMARMHLKKCLRLHPQGRIARYYLWMANLLPQIAVKWIYQILSPNAGYTFVEK